MKKKMKKKKEKFDLTYWDKKWYKVLLDIISMISIVVTIISLIVAVKSLKIAELVRKDTEELTRMSEKDIYYTIRLYPTSDMKQYEEYENYIRLKLRLVVDDFKIEKKESLKVNYNATFTHIKYFMVYDYDREKKEYQYFVTKLDNKTEAQMRLEDQYSINVTEMNYSLTPNKKFAYVLIYTESVNKKNLDLIFFRYQDKGESLSLDTQTNENGDIEIEHERIDRDAALCKQYYINTNVWSRNEQEKQDIAFMFEIYSDLEQKL